MRSNQPSSIKNFFGGFFPIEKPIQEVLPIPVSQTMRSVYDASGLRVIKVVLTEKQRDQLKVFDNGSIGKLGKQMANTFNQRIIFLFGDHVVRIVDPEKVSEIQFKINSP